MKPLKPSSTADSRYPFSRRHADAFHTFRQRAAPAAAAGGAALRTLRCGEQHVDRGGAAAVGIALRVGPRPAHRPTSTHHDSVSHSIRFDSNSFACTMKEDVERVNVSTDSAWHCTLTDVSWSCQRQSGEFPRSLQRQPARTRWSQRCPPAHWRTALDRPFTLDRPAVRASVSLVC